tara:strand:- start:11113 stop:12027 length:915 start_codon:yes stop_codon:yes gene_type:complete
LSEYLDSGPEHIVIDSSVSVIAGSAALTVLDRSVTSNLTEMGALDKKRTLFCDANGRVEDIATVCVVEDRILMISSSEYGDETRKKLVDGIGWDEECTLLKGDEAISHISVLCYDSNDVIPQFGLEKYKLSTDEMLERGDLLFTKTEFDGCELVEILSPSAKLDSVLTVLNDLGSKLAVEERWDFLRISLGAHSIDDAKGNLPNELGLGELVSLDKGCYPGQEIHARIDSRGKTIKNLARLVSDSPIEIGTHKVEGIGKISVTSTQFVSGVSLSLAMCPIIDIPPERITMDDGNEAIIESLTFP